MGSGGGLIEAGLQVAMAGWQAKQEEAAARTSMMHFLPASRHGVFSHVGGACTHFASPFCRPTGEQHAQTVAVAGEQAGRRKHRGQLRAWQEGMRLAPRGRAPLACRRDQLRQCTRASRT